MMIIIVGSDQHAVHVEANSSSFFVTERHIHRQMGMSAWVNNDNMSNNDDKKSRIHSYFLYLACFSYESICDTVS